MAETAPATPCEVPGTPLEHPGGDATRFTQDEIGQQCCCTCNKPVDENNSLVIARAGGKTKVKQDVAGMPQRTGCYCPFDCQTRQFSEGLQQYGWRQVGKFLQGTQSPPWRRSQNQSGGTCAGLEI